MSKKFETQFSIYKVNYERSKKYFEEEYNIHINSYVELENQILSTIKDKINLKKRSEIQELDNKDFKGFVFKTFHYPNWYGIVDELLDKKFDISNTHISYLITYLYENHIFILTAGLGSSYINEFTQKNYGLMLLPKILNETTPSIKSVLENRMSGNKLSNKHSNRNATTINLENDMSSIFRELSLEINKEIIQMLGVESEKEMKLLNIVAKDSFVIKKSVSLENLIKILQSLVQIEKREDNFSLGYFVDIKKYHYSNKEMKEIMYNYLENNKIDNFILVGDDYSNYCVGGTRYVISDRDNNIILDSVEPLTFENVFELCIKPNPSKTNIDKVLKYNLSVENDGQTILFPTKLFDCIQGHIENNEGKPFFLYNGIWLMFDDNYVDNLDKEYRKNFNDLTNMNSKLEKILINTNKDLSEDSYNKSFSLSDEIIVSHTVLSNNIELADLIYYDNDIDTLYLVHNKSKFQGNGSRDVLNQILTSAEFIKHYDLSQNKNNILGKYYEDILNKYPNNMIKDIEKEKFISYFTSSTEVCFIAGFMDGVSESTNSNYAKYITIDAYKKLVEYGYKLIIFNINE